MNTVRTLIAACFIGVVCFFALSSAEAATPIFREGRYKDFYSNGWFGTYALREFDKGAPVPGVNWFVDDAQDWLARAQRDGWVITQKASEAVNGSIILGYHEGLVWVGIAREVTDKGMIFETDMGGEGKPARYWMNFSDLPKLIHYKGCILPQRAPGAKSVSPMLDYKGVRGFNGAAWPVREFDKGAPRPGFNWQGPIKEWALDAAQSGWIVEKKPSAAKKGGILIFINPETQQEKVAFVRDVVDSIIVLEFVDPPFSRVITARLSKEQLTDRMAFGGYIFSAVILPERKGR